MKLKLFDELPRRLRRGKKFKNHSLSWPGFNPVPTGLASQVRSRNEDSAPLFGAEPEHSSGLKPRLKGEGLFSVPRAKARGNSSEQKGFSI